MCILIFSTNLTEIFRILRKVEQDVIKNVYRCSWQAPVIRIRFLKKFEYFDRFSIDTQISNFMKIRPVGADSFHADRRTDITKLICERA